MNMYFGYIVHFRYSHWHSHLDGLVFFLFLLLFIWSCYEQQSVTSFRCASFAEQFLFPLARSRLSHCSSQKRTTICYWRWWNECYCVNVRASKDSCVVAVFFFLYSSFLPFARLTIIFIYDIGLSVKDICKEISVRLYFNSITLTFYFACILYWIAEKKNISACSTLCIVVHITHNYDMIARHISSDGWFFFFFFFNLNWWAENTTKRNFQLSVNVLIFWFHLFDSEWNAFIGCEQANEKKKK